MKEVILDHGRRTEISYKFAPQDPNEGRYETVREPGTGFCHTCNTQVPIKWEDIGIGAYEYWGAKGTHHDWIAVCPECGDDLSEIVTNCDEGRDHEKEDQHRENV